MVAERHYMSPDIRSTMTNLNKEWKDLSDKAKDKGIKLRQAAQQVKTHSILHILGLRTRISFELD